MTTTQQPYDPHALAGAARSVLARPASARLVVEGLGHPDDRDDLADLAVHDEHGMPTFACAPDSLFARAAEARRAAHLTLVAGAETALEQVTMLGRLELRGTERHDGSDATPAHAVAVVALVLGEVRAVPRTPAGATGPSYGVALSRFQSREHDLNDGYLRQVVEHTNARHHEHLRHTVTTALGLRPGSVAGASLADLTRDGVEVHWVDLDGAHVRRMWFPRPARTPTELGALLQRGICAGLA